MKKELLLLIISVFLISGCENKEEAMKNEYIAMKTETLNDKNYTKDELPVDIVTTINRVTEEEVEYKTTIANPKENMHNVKVLLVHNYYNEDRFPSIGLFDKPEELLTDSAEEVELVLKDTIQTTTNISKLNLELKLLIEYTNDLGEKKDIYYKTT